MTLNKTNRLYRICKIYYLITLQNTQRPKAASQAIDIDIYAAKWPMRRTLRRTLIVTHRARPSSTLVVVVIGRALSIPHCPVNGTCYWTVNQQRQTNRFREKRSFLEAGPFFGTPFQDVFSVLLFSVKTLLNSHSFLYLCTCVLVKRHQS